MNQLVLDTAWIDRAARWFVLSLFTLGIILLGSGCTNLACSETEQKVLAEFPQYGGTRLTPEGNVDTGACAVYYGTADSPEMVADYFRKQLTAHGWTLSATPAAGTLIEAERGPFSYVVYYEAGLPSLGANTHLAVHVRED